MVKFIFKKCINIWSSYCIRVDIFKLSIHLDLVYWDKYWDKKLIIKKIKPFKLLLLHSFWFPVGNKVDTLTLMYRSWMTNRYIFKSYWKSISHYLAINLSDHLKKTMLTFFFRLACISLCSLNIRIFIKIYSINVFLKPKTVNVICFN